MTDKLSLDEIRSGLRSLIAVNGGDQWWTGNGILEAADEELARLQTMEQENAQQKAQIRGLTGRADWSNHHNALACPYCNPDGQVGGGV
jgi:hypothetical protein